MQKLFFALVMATVVGCAAQNPPQSTGSKPATNAAGQFGTDSYAAHIKTLSSDEFEGRSPFTEGETRTIEYLSGEFARIGLEPGNGNSWVQQVPMVEITAATSTLSFSALERSQVEIGTDAVIGTKRVTDSVELADSELVFVGYGIVAPEYGWNDYAGLDARGKTVVIMVNDPGFATQDSQLFNGNAMTYYGRWTYKYEEAARQGAAGALIIHETGPAGYPWAVVRGGWTGPQFDLFASDRNFSRAQVEGWINTTTAAELFAEAGMTLLDARRRALRRDFIPFRLPGTMSAKIKNSIRESHSYNVVGRLPGSDLTDELIVYMAHWDHLGRDPSLEGDQIYNGAVDNASGTAALIEIANAFANQPVKPRRSILFMAVTAEESGLLGSRHYGTNPLYPLNKTVAGINMDGLNVHGRTRDVAVVGFGSSELEQYLTRAAASQDRIIVPEPTPEKGFFYRSDHFNLAKQGVPVLYAESGFDYREGGLKRGRELAHEWVADRYHKPADEYRDDWDLSGAVEDMQLYYMIGAELAASDDWPEWYSTSEFRAIRDASLQD